PSFVHCAMPFELEKKMGLSATMCNG
ncbi:uncharacterized protein METZ01_LOCUS446767, partial [marine metagenome]